MIWYITNLAAYVKSVKVRVKTDTNEWVPLRPENYRYESYLYRFKAAWWVLTGKADAVVWAPDI